MNGMSRSLCTFENVGPQVRTMDKCPLLRLTLQDQVPARQGQPIQNPEALKSKPVGLAFALVQPHDDSQMPVFEPIKPTEEKVEIIKVYLEASMPKQAEQRDEQSHIHEVKRYCLKTLREKMTTRNNSNNDPGELRLTSNGHRVLPTSQSTVTKHSKGGAAPETQDWEEEQESARIREVSKRLYAQLQEVERRHQEERERFQAESSRYRQQLSEQTERLCRAEQGLEERDQRIEDLQRLLRGMEVESTALRDKMKASETELLELRVYKEDQSGKDQRSEDLEKELAILKEKIHHLDDMLKSQQRKVRHMIEQLQNSRTVIQERDRIIRELEEKVAFLQAENREMRDQVDYFLGNQRPSSYLSPEHDAHIVYSKPLRPSTQGNKALPFIKVIEINS